jgi:hypothetical protein
MFGPCFLNKKRLLLELDGQAGQCVPEWLDKASVECRGETRCFIRHLVLWIAIPDDDFMGVNDWI